MSHSDELLALSSVELRRRIGSKEMSPVELLEAAIGRIEALNPAVNAIAATDFARARKLAVGAQTDARKGERLGPLHGLPTGIKDLHETAGLLTTYGSPLYRSFVPAHDAAMVALVRKAGAIIVAKTNMPEFGAGANTRNLVWGATETRSTRGSMPAAPRAARRSRSLATCCRCAPAPIPGGRCGYRRPFAGWWDCGPPPGSCRRTRRLGWTPISVLGPLARSVADLRLLFSAQVGMDDREPMAFPLDPEAIAPPRAVDLGRLRVAFTEDFGQCPCASDIRLVFRSRIAAMRPPLPRLRRGQLRLRRGRPLLRHRARTKLRRPLPSDAYDKDPDSLGANVRGNYEMAAGMTLADMAWAHAEQTLIFRRFQARFRDYDLVVSLTTPVSPFPWTQLYLESLEGTRLRNYYHWLALTYVITLVTNPAISLPCGVDEHAMPFGLQVIGRFRGDCDLLDAAEAMEHAFAGSPGLGRPRPDLAKLAKSTVDLKSIATHPPILQ